MKKYKYIFAIVLLYGLIFYFYNEPKKKEDTRDFYPTDEEIIKLNNGI